MSDQSVPGINHQPDAVAALIARNVFERFLGFREVLAQFEIVGALAHVCSSFKEYSASHPRTGRFDVHASRGPAERSARAALGNQEFVRRLGSWGASMAKPRGERSAGCTADRHLHVVFTLRATGSE